MTLGRLFWSAILLTLILSTAMMCSSGEAIRYYTDLEEQMNVRKQGAIPIYVSWQDDNSALEQIIQREIDGSGSYKVVVSDAEERPRQFRYCFEKKMRILEWIDAYGDIIKRELTDELGRYRVRVLLTYRGDVVSKNS